jgi:hypothetical protein
MRGQIIRNNARIEKWWIFVYNHRINNLVFRRLYMSDFTYTLPFSLEKYRAGIITTLKRKGQHELAHLLDGCQIQLDERGFSYYYNNTGRWDATAVVVLIYIGIDKIDRLNAFPKSVLTRICDELIPSNVGFDVKTVEFIPNLQGDELDNKSSLALPDKQEETLRTLLDDINSALERNQPTLVLDRMHTYSTKLLRHLCEEHDINVKHQLETTCRCIV